MDKSADKPPGEQEPEDSKKPPSPSEAAAKEAREYASKLKAIVDEVFGEVSPGNERTVLEMHYRLHQASEAARSAQEAADDADAKIAKANAAKAKAAYDAAVDFWLGGPAPAPEG